MTTDKPIPDKPIPDEPIKDEPVPDFTDWERAERSRLIGYIFGLLDAAKSERLLMTGLEDGIQFVSPWSGAICTLRLELGDEVPDPPPDWAKP